jgi:glycyl-tRNA synthetase alpha subunit
MLESYMQNSSVKMTKDTYFEMCEALGTAPIESEIPVEFEDLPDVIQEVLQIYRLLKDDWDTVNGNYLGKTFQGILDIFNIMEVDVADRRTYLLLLHLIDSVRSEQIKKSKPKD